MHLPFQAAGRRYLRFFRNGMTNTSEVANSRMFRDAREVREWRNLHIYLHSFTGTSL